jgi:hypothetical protein
MRGPDGDDDPDLGIRPAHEALLSLADRLDAEKAAVLKACAPELEAAASALAACQHEAAAALYDLVAKAFREAHLPGDAETWERRARDFREVARFYGKAKKKGGRRR